MNWSLIVPVAIFFGAVHLENARKSLYLRPLTLLQAGLAAWLLLRECESGGCSRAVQGALIFSASAPFLGYLWWGRQGKIRRAIVKTGVAAIVVASAGLMALPLGAGPAVGAAIVSAVALLLPWRWLRKKAELRRTRRHQEALEAEARHEEEERERQEAADRAEDQVLLEEFVEHLRR